MKEAGSRRPRIPDDALSALTIFGEPARRVELARGDLLFRRGDRAAEIFRLERGRLRLERITRDGYCLTVHHVVSGESFAEAALFAENYACDAVALKASTVSVYPAPEVAARLSMDSDAALATIRVLAGQVRDLRTRLEMRSVRPAERRVLDYLLYLDLHGRLVEERPLKHLAAEIGLSPEAFYRTIASLVEEGAVRREGKQLRLTRKT